MKKNSIASKGPQVLNRNIQAFKKVEAWDGRLFIGDVVIELLIPKGSTVVRRLPDKWWDSPTPSKKCRTDRAKAVRIVWVQYPWHWGLQSRRVKNRRSLKIPNGLKLRAAWQHRFVYKLGRYSKSRLNRDTYETCASGLHFYLNVTQAIRH